MRQDSHNNASCTDRNLVLVHLRFVNISDKCLLHVAWIDLASNSEMFRNYNHTLLDIFFFFFFAWSFGKGIMKAVPLHQNANQNARTSVYFKRNMVLLRVYVLLGVE